MTDLLTDEDDGDDDFAGFSEGMVGELFRHYIGLQHKIRLELDLLGIDVFEMDFADDNYWLQFCFEELDDAITVVELTECESYPSETQWEIVEQDCCFDLEGRTKKSFVLVMPRMDAFIAFTMLRRLAEATVCAKHRADRLAAHETRLGLPYVSGGHPCRTQPISKW